MVSRTLKGATTVSSVPTLYPLLFQHSLYGRLNSVSPIKVSPRVTHPSNYVIFKERGVAVHIMWRFILSLSIFYCQIKKQNNFSIMYIILHNKYELHSRTIYVVTKSCWPFKVLHKIFNNLFIMIFLLYHVHSYLTESVQLNLNIMYLLYFNIY